MKTDFQHILENRKANILKSYGEDMYMSKSKNKKEEKSDMGGSDMGSDVMESATDDFDEHRNHPKFKKIMDEWKVGTLKTPAGESVTDQKQAEAIAFSEASSEGGVQKALDILYFGNKSSYIEKAEKEEPKKDGEDKFNHHRKMAGYHAVKEKEALDAGIDLGGSSNEGVGKKAGEKSKEAKKHNQLTQEHLERAKKLHDKEKHGEWNDTIPTHKEAKEYGSKHVSEIDNNEQSDEAVKPDKEKVQKAFYVLSADYIEKSEGSRGGKVIGHTKSGKPVYEGKHPREYSHKEFSPKDHKDASKIHDEKGDQYLSKQHKVQGEHNEESSSDDDHGIKVGQNYNHDAYGKVKVTKVEKNTGENANKISHLVHFEHHQDVAGYAGGNGKVKRTESQGINGFNQSAKEDNSVDNKKESKSNKFQESEEKVKDLREKQEKLSDKGLSLSKEERKELDKHQAIVDKHSKK